MDGNDLPGGVYAEIDGRVRPASHLRGQSHFTLTDDVSRVERSAASRLFKRVVSGRWRDEPVTVWAARTPGVVRIQYDGHDSSRARALGMRGDRTMWDLDVPPSEVTVTHVDEVDLD